MANSPALAVVMPPCNTNMTSDFDRDQTNVSAWESYRGGRGAVIDMTLGQDGLPLMAIGCGKLIPILTTPHGASTLSVVS